VLGRCILNVDDQDVWSASYGQKTQTFVPNGYNGTLSEAFVTDELAAGKHQFRVDCTEEEADIAYITALAAVRLSSS
jgi:hypothetical protein